MSKRQRFAWIVGACGVLGAVGVSGCARPSTVVLTSAVTPAAAPAAPAPPVRAPAEAPDAPAEPAAEEAVASEGASPSVSDAPSGDVSFAALSAALGDDSRLSVRNVGGVANAPSSVVRATSAPEDHAARAIHQAIPEATVRAGAMTVTPGLAVADVRAVITAEAPRLRACYARGLDRSPSLEGRVVVTFVIGAGGAVSAVRADGAELGDDDVAECVRDVFAGLTFPSPRADQVRVTYPVEFRPDA